MSNTDSDLSKLDSYTISYFNVVFKLKNTKLFNEVTISAIINNLLNTNYVSNGYHYTYDDTWSNPDQAVTYEGVGYYPQATRNYLLGITFKF
jgi:iron complex outermembrane receptor protein